MNQTQLTGSKSMYMYMYYTPAPESETCNGTVTGVQICYQSTINTYVNETFAKFVLLTKNNTHFKVVKNFSLNSHMTADVCANVPVSYNRSIKHICCEKMTLDSSNQFIISSMEDFRFGILNIMNKIKPLRFTKRRYNAMHYQSKEKISNLPSNLLIDNFTKESRGSLMVLRFIIGKLNFYIWKICNDNMYQ